MNLGFFSATTQVMVTIADKNDNTPYFEKLLYEKEVDEQPADSSKSILTVKARDIDDGKLWKRRRFLSSWTEKKISLYFLNFFVHSCSIESFVFKLPLINFLVIDNPSD